jgi:hypothetical protein
MLLKKIKKKSFAKVFIVFPAPHPTHVTYLHVCWNYESTTLLLNQIKIWVLELRDTEGIWYEGCYDQTNKHQARTYFYWCFLFDVPSPYQ